MSYKDLREFINTLKKHGELVEINEEVTPILEITEITDRVCKAGGPALLFKKVKGFKIPVLTSAFGGERRLKIAFEVEDLDHIAQRIEGILNVEAPRTWREKIKILSQIKEFSSFPPKIIKDGPCHEVIVRDNPSFDEFPILKCWPEDGGRFITLPLVFTREPRTGQRNVGMYRMQVYDNKTTGMHWHLHKDAAAHFRIAKESKRPLEVAVAIGADPLATYVATAPLPYGLDEMLFAGFLRRKGVEMVKCKTINLEVPATAEIVLEGHVDPQEMRMEGPFGDHTGYYSPPDLYPVFHLNCVTHRKNPIYAATVVGKPPMEDCFLGKATERIFLPIIRFQLPEVKDINMPLEGVFHNCVIVSIKKSYPGQARKVMNALWGGGQLMFSKFIIVVEDDVEVHNLREVAWKVFGNVDPERDTVLSKGPIDVLDHASSTPIFGYKMGIDATKKTKEEGYLREWPQEIKMDNETKELVDRKWKRLNLD